MHNNVQQYLILHSFLQNIFFFFFQHIKMSKAFTLEKSQKKKKEKKKKLFVDGIYAPLFHCLWHMRNQFTVYSGLQPYPSYRAQPFLYATGKMSLNWGLDCSSVCSMHAPVVNCLPSFGSCNHEFFFRESNTCIWNNDVTLYFFGSVKGFLSIS